MKTSSSRCDCVSPQLICHPEQSEGSLYSPAPGEMHRFFASLRMTRELTGPLLLNYNLLVPVLHNLRVTLEMIKWEHSIFALPFALCGAMLAAGGFPSPHQSVWIVVAMIAARSAAMAFNRWADAAIDGANPRTSTRALPAGHLSPAFVITFVIVSSAIFV